MKVKSTPGYMLAQHSFLGIVLKRLMMMMGGGEGGEDRNRVRMGSIV